MEVTSNQTAGAASAIREATTSRSTALTADFDTFLQMLTAQARFQDPLDPMDSSEYAAQLAQFSMVEQQVVTNEAIADLTAALTASGLDAISGWVGMDVRSPLPTEFNGSPVTVLPSIAAGADQAFAIVRSSSGTEVDRMPIELGAESIEWNGTSEDGLAFPYGTYRIEVESWANGQRIDIRPTESFGRVREARIVDGQPALVLDSNEVVSVSDVTAIRNGT